MSLHRPSSVVYRRMGRRSAQIPGERIDSNARMAMQQRRAGFRIRDTASFWVEYHIAAKAGPAASARVKRPAQGTSLLILEGQAGSMGIRALRPEGKPALIFVPPSYNSIAPALSRGGATYSAVSRTRLISTNDGQHKSRQTDHKKT